MKRADQAAQLTTVRFVRERNYSTELTGRIETTRGSIAGGVRTGGLEVRRVRRAVDARRVPGGRRGPTQVVLERRVAPQRAASARRRRRICAGNGERSATGGRQTLANKAKRE